MADRIAWNPWGELDCRMVLFTSDLDPTILRMRLSINSPAGMGRRAATFQSSRLRYCITARWAMLGNSADCLPVIPVCFLGRSLARVLREGFAPCSREPAKTAERRIPAVATRRDCVAQYGPASPPVRTLRVPGGSVCELTMLLNGPIVSTMILIPPNALSIWRCTLATSDVRNSCIFWSSETNP